MAMEIEERRRIKRTCLRGGYGGGDGEDSQRDGEGEKKSESYGDKVRVGEG